MPPLQTAIPRYVHTRSGACALARFHGAAEPAMLEVSLTIDYHVPTWIVCLRMYLPAYAALRNITLSVISLIGYAYAYVHVIYSQN